MENIVIIWWGPAGNSAAIYAARADLSPLMFEWFYAAGMAAGGQLTTTTEVENYPGFTSINGPELMIKMREQALHCGARIETKTVESVDLSAWPYKVIVDGQVIETKTIIITTGATAKRMWVPGEETFWQKGISACAVCDGALPIFRNQPVTVVGGGDVACEEAMHMAKFASHVTLLVRRDVMRASKAMQERVKNNPKISILRNTELLEVAGEWTLRQAKIVNNQTKEESMLDVRGLFYAIGHTPNTAFLQNQLELDETGYIKTTPGTTKTSKDGVFAAGDVQDHIYRQAVTSAGTGCMAALDAERWLWEHGA